ncbi:MAG: DUF262 domain-containing protein [Arcobacter sp.]|uniref:DUF262 domain-containing protein n=1 Tax=Arcobacter sp. TaxID=1872629 RepID=UPI003D061C0E
MASNQLESLKDIFNGKFLRIPDYQRGYAWGEHQLKDFWEDLENLEDGHIHYTGVLTLEKVTNQKKDEKIEFWKKDTGAYESDSAYYVVDGQQRITTSIILLKVILDKTIELKANGLNNIKLEKLYEKYIKEETLNGTNQYFFGYTADNPSYEFLKTKIFNEKSASNEKKETLYTTNLEYAKTFFTNEIKDFDIEKIEKIFKKLTEQFKFNVYEISDDLDVFIAFETMNNRGKKLSNLELLKNRLIYLSTKFKENNNDKENLRRNINDCWKTIYEYLGKNKNNILEDDTFLKNHWIMYHDYSREKGNDYIIDLLEERYVAKRIITKKEEELLSIKEINDYVLSLKESVEHWYYLHNPDEANYNDKIKYILDKLYRLNYGAFAPLLMAIFSRDSEYNIDEVCGLLRLMEKYIFLIFKISQRRANTGDSAFYGFARQYYKKELSIINIIGIKDLEIEKNTGINWWLAKYFDLNSFYTYLSDKFKNRDGYYSWNGLSYFLFEYELNLKNQSRNSTPKINWKDYTVSKTDYRSIEHILPQTPSEDCWQKEIVGLSEFEVKKLTNSLGNLVPLSSAKNSKLQNYCFEIKKNGKDGTFTGYKNGSYSEQKINEKINWGIYEIHERGIDLLTFMAEHWDIKELNESKQKEFLFLDNIFNNK